MMTKKLAGALALSLIAATSAHSQSLGVDFTGPGNLFNNDPWTLGYSFDANANVTVTGLAYYNPSGSGDAVGLWDANGDLLAVATVDSTDPTLGSAPFNYVNLRLPVTLTAGDEYFVGGENNGTQNYAYNTVGFSVNPNITFIQDQFVLGSTLAFPVDTDSFTAAEGGGWFGGNIVLNGTVPDGATTMGLMGLALAGLGLVRRKIGA